MDTAALHGTTASSSATMGFTKKDDNKFKFHVDDLIRFIFPISLQHPLAAGRLFAFALNGPLDDNLQIRTGASGKRILADYELEQMCLQFEKEDIVQIYLHKSRDMGLLTSQEQEAIISQADDKLKKAKGKASLPRLVKKDIYDLLSGLTRDEFDRISFHDAQKIIIKFRKDRIKELKLVYPSIAVKADHKEMREDVSSQSSTIKLPKITGGGMNGDNQEDDEEGDGVLSSSTRNHQKRISRVSESVAPTIMFQRNKGLNNAELVNQTTKYLCQHASKIIDIDQKATSSITSNVKLLREIPPFCKDPYPKDGPLSRSEWNNNSTMTGTGLGSMVKSCNSATTWKRKVTSY